MDRFSSHEEFPGQNRYFKGGALARRRGRLLFHNPYDPTSRAWQWWNAGWADADQGLAADQTYNQSRDVAEEQEEEQHNV